MNELHAEWQPKTRTELCYVETMVTSQWLLTRVARSEQQVYMTVGVCERQFALLAQVAKQRAHLERSFRTAIADMKQAQKERQVRQQPQPAKSTRPPAHEPVEHNPGPWPPDPGGQRAFCAPATTDTR